MSSAITSISRAHRVRLLEFLPWLEGAGIFSGKFVYREGELVDHQVVFYEE